MPEDDVAALRALLLDPDRLVRAAASGARRGLTPRWERVRLRPVELGVGRRLQVEAFDATQSFTSNHDYADDGEAGATAVVDALLAEGFRQWHADGVVGGVSLRWSAKDRAIAQRLPASPSGPLAHDRPKARLLPEDHPVLRALGISDAQGRVKPSRRAKYTQVERFLAELDHAVDDAGLPATRPWSIVDLGCGNAYLTLAAVARLEARGIEASVLGIDVKAQSLAHNAEVAASLGWSHRARFAQAAIADVPHDVTGGEPDVVVALHACDTATDDALAFGVASGAAVVLAAPCCHHDVQRQLAEHGPPEPYGVLTRHAILRERYGDVLTDALRAAVLRLLGYRVEVVEFVPDEHTPRNVMIRALRPGVPAPTERWREYDELVSLWGVRPRLATLLADELEGARHA